MIYSSWNIEYDRLKLIIMGHFLHFHPPKNPKIRILKKCKKFQDIIILHMCTKNHNHMRYSSWDMEMIFFVILGYLLPFYSPNNLANQNLEKTKKASGDVISLHICTKNHDHMMYASWDMEWDRQFFVILGHFCPFTPLLTPKIKIWKKYNKRLTNDITLLHTCTIYEDHMMYGSWDIRHERQIFLLFWAILVLWPS